MLQSLQEKREQQDGAIKRAPVKAQIVENVENVMKIWPLCFLLVFILRMLKFPYQICFLSAAISDLTSAKHTNILAIF